MCPRDSAEVFVVPLKAVEGFVWEGSARRLGFGCSGEPCFPLMCHLIRSCQRPQYLSFIDMDVSQPGPAWQGCRRICGPYSVPLRTTCTRCYEWHVCQLCTGASLASFVYLISPSSSSSLFLSPYRSPGVSSRSKPEGLKLLFFLNSLNYSHFHSLSCLCFKVHMCCVLVHKFNFQSFSPSLWNVPVPLCLSTGIRLSFTLSHWRGLSDRLAGLDAQGVRLSGLLRSLKYFLTV